MIIALAASEVSKGLCSALDSRQLAEALSTPI
jgi:hypothetical protein